jgi:hypothetical protein
VTADPPRRFKWVALPGRDVCVWRITGNEPLEAEYFTGLGVEPGSPECEALALEEQLFWQFVVSCHHGPPPHGQRLFADLGALAIDRLGWVEKAALSAAICELNEAPATDGQGESECQR